MTKQSTGSQTESSTILAAARTAMRADIAAAENAAVGAPNDSEARRRMLDVLESRLRSRSEGMDPQPLRGTFDPLRVRFPAREAAALLRIAGRIARDVLDE